MEPEDYVMRIAYVCLFITLALMTWAVQVQAGSSDQSVHSLPLVSTNPLHTNHHASNLQGFEDHPPCSFNLLCSCSKPGPSEFGIVACHQVPFANIPFTLNSSRAFMLSMYSNDLMVLEEKRLVGSALWRLEIKNNKLYYIADDAFIGLAKFLTELDLHNNELTEIPTTALKKLSKLRLLNLSGNQITDVYPGDFDGLPTTLNCLSLANNMITNILEGAFSKLPRLERLDLSGNSLQFVHPQAFVGVSKSLSHLYMSQNLLKKIPFEALSILKLKHLDLSHNLITSTFDVLYQGKLQVATLLLDYNRIELIPIHSFQNFKKISKVSFSHNPTRLLIDDGFKDSGITDLDLSHCFIEEIYSKAFRGLASSLERLDLQFNNITFLPLNIFEHFHSLRVLKLDENKLQIGQEEFSDLHSLYSFSLMGDSVPIVPMDSFRIMRSIRNLNISRFEQTILVPKTFEGFALAVEELKISQGKIISISNSAFMHLTGLRSLDLSDNKIGRIEDEAFEEIGHSLGRLKLSNALRLNTVNPAALQRLSGVKELDLSSNGLKELGTHSFDKCGLLTHLNLRFNKLTNIPKRLFDHGKTPRLQYLAMSFNSINEVKEGCFSGLSDIENIELNENAIERIHRRAFEDLTSLKILNLAGNRITSLSDEAFLNLPRLQLLDLSKNDLTVFNIDAFEQLGTLGSFRIDATYNKIKTLGIMERHTPTLRSVEQKPTIGQISAGELSIQEENFTERLPTPNPFSISSSSIESLDLSHNNISYIAPHFFGPISNTLIELDLSNNQLVNLTKEHLGGLRFIQQLKVDHNRVDIIEYDTLRDSKLIQILSFNHNLIRDLAPDLLEDCIHLRVLSIEGNKIRNLADSLFKDTKLEILSVSGNQLVRFPEASLSKIASTLVRLDLSGNEISSLTSSQIECLQRLRWLSVANNRIVVVADTTFDHLGSLLYIDFSGNPMGRISSRLFEETKKELLHLHLSNMSLEALPFDTFPKLLTFNASFNSLTYLPTNFGVNVSALRTLDISGNEIVTPPNTIWHQIPRLSHVIMGDNPIKILTNDSFLQLERLHSLDISELPLDSVQVGLLSPLICLKNLKIGPLHSSANPGALIQSVESLHHIHLLLETPMMSNEMRKFSVPEKLLKITITGPHLLSISKGTFQGLRNRDIHLVIHDTGLTDLGEEVMHTLGDVTDVTLEVRGNNSALKSIGNPSAQFRPEPFNTYLKDFFVDEHLSISCTCDAGWIEFWLRQKMQKSCPVVPKSVNTDCEVLLKSLRRVDCIDKPGFSLLDAFVHELECGWESSASSNFNHYNSISILSSLIIILLFSAKIIIY